MALLFTLVATLNRRHKTLILLSADVLLVPFSMGLTCLIMIGSWNAHFPPNLALIGLMSASAILFSILLGMPRIKLNAYEQKGVRQTAWFTVLVSLTGFAGMRLFSGIETNLGLMVVFAMTLLIVSVSNRILLRNILLALYRNGNTRQRILIYGAGQTGVQLASALQTDNTVVPVAFVDDNKTLHKITVAGMIVYSPREIDELVKEHAIDRVVMAMPSISRSKQARIAQRLSQLGCEVSALPSFAALVGEDELIERIQPIDASDFLGRKKIECDLNGLCDIYSGRSIMITGSGGSIGSELTRQILACVPSKILLFELSEHALYQIEYEILELGSELEGVEIVSVLGSVTDEKAVKRAISENNIDIILHAAAYKHVPMVEKNRLAGLRNNIIGTRVLVDAAREAEISHFIMISTDKAVNPTNVMGASKRMAELYIQNAATQFKTTKFGIVRFGNVLGSSGSVVPLFEEQIARGGPVTLTHQEVTRYFMTIPEAARLVLLAGSYCGQTDVSGDVFLLDMGDPVPIRNLARQMIEAAGYTVCDRENPAGDIEIVITGLRPGEKVHEELAVSGHIKTSTDHPKITRIEEGKLSQVEIETAMHNLCLALKAENAQLAKDIVFHWINLDRPDRVTPNTNVVFAKPEAASNP